MSESSRPIRSYQRIFTPERRIYQIDGRRLPVPGGVPLAWLGWMFTSLLAVFLLSQRSLALALFLGGVAGLIAGGISGWRGSLVAGTCSLGVLVVLGVILSWLAWPLRLVVVPALVATVAARPSPDGRPMHRYLISRTLVRSRVKPRSLERPVPAEGEPWVWAPRMSVSSDQHSPGLERGRVYGPARLEFAHRVVAIPRPGRLVVRPEKGHRLRRGERLARVIELGAGQVVEVRP